MLISDHQFGVKSMRMAGKNPGSVYDPDECPFLAQSFREHGYVMAQIGKWHTRVVAWTGIIRWSGIVQSILRMLATIRKIRSLR
jgi:hypothetical protein